MAIHFAAELEEGREALTLADQLAEAGLSEKQIGAVEALVEAEVERAGMHFAAGVLRRLAAHISTHSTAGAALIHALGLTDESCTALGAKLGVSKQGINNLVRAIAPLLGPLAQSKAAPHKITRPSEPGEWLSLPESSRLTARSAAVIQSAGQLGELRRVMVGNRSFFEESDLLRWSAELTLRPSLWNQPKHRPLPNSNTAASPKLSEPPKPPGSCEPRPKTCTPNLPEARSA